MSLSTAKFLRKPFHTHTHNYYDLPIFYKSISNILHRSERIHKKPTQEKFKYSDELKTLSDTTIKISKKQTRLEKRLSAHFY